jgi:hypothetical protein
MSDTRIMKTIAIIALTLALVCTAFARDKYVPNANVTPEVVQRAAAAVPNLRGMMRDPDSFVLEQVFLRESTDKYAKDVNSQPPAFCYFFRSHNAMGGYGDTGEAVLDSKGKLDILDANDPNRSKVYIAMMTCTPKRRLADITTQVSEVLHPTPKPEAPQTPEEQAQKAQQYADCMKAAVNNASIVCKP